MRTFLLFLTAAWLVAIRLLVSGGAVAPWSAIEPALPFIILVSIAGSSHAGVRFAAFVGLFESLVFPGYGLSVMPVLLAVAFFIGPLFRLVFTSPAPGSLLAAAVVGSLIYETGSAIVSAGLWYQVGLPDANVWLASLMTRFAVTLVILVITGEAYRRAVLRFRQAFVGARTSV